MAEDHRNYRERRIQTRYPVDLHAKVRGRNQLPTNCRVRNICNGGVLLETGGVEPELPFLSGEHIDIHFDLPDAQSMDPVQGVIEVAHRVDRGVGARFIRLSGDGRARLARFVSEASASYTPDDDPEHNPARTKARDVLRDVGEDQLGGLVDSLLESLVEELWSHSERAESDSDRTRFAGEIGLLAKAIQDDSISRGLRRELIDSLGNLGRGDKGGAAHPAKQAPDPSVGGLELVDQDEFEIWLAKSELTNRLEQDLKEPLESLRTRLAGLFQNTSLPLEPLALAEAIERSLSDIGVGLDLQRLSLQIASNHLSRNLGVFYRELLRAWSTAGLSAFESVSPGAGESPSAPDAGKTDAAAAPDSSPDPMTAALSADRDAPDRMRDTRATGGAAAGPGQSPPPPSSSSPIQAKKRPAKHFTGWRRIADLLENLPTDYKIPDPSADRSLKELVAQWLQAAEVKQTDHQSDQLPVMSPQVEERVDVTDRLLAHMLADPSTPQPLKSLIQPLSTRFLSMAVSESGAVGDAGQPLVRLINQLEHLSLFLLNEDAEDKKLRHEVEGAIKTLVSTEGRDRHALDEISNRLGKVELHTSREYQVNIVNWVDVCESRERGRLAREKVRERLNDAFTGQRVHSVVDELLEIGWRKLLESVCANTGIEGARWRNYWQLLVTLQDMTNGEGPRGGRHTREIDALIQDLRSGLAYIGTDQVLCNEVLGRIDTAVRRVRASMNRDDDYLIFSPLAPDADSESERPPRNLSKADWGAALARVDELPLGALIWMRAKETDKALRLIWRNEDGSRLAVTDTMGKKMKVLPRHRLADAFTRGQARAQEQTEKRMVTRAADAALSEMQDRLRYHETHDPLTGLSNQRRLMGALTQLLLTEADSAPAHALCFLELDRYDTLTGTFGYSAGEQMLLSVAKLLGGVVPDAACLAFMGGCRFGLLMPALDRDHAGEIGEAIRAGLTAMPFDLQGKSFRVSGSLGIAMLAGDTTNPDKLISVASVACLAAQREGGDRAILFSEDNEIITRQLDHMRGREQAEDVIKTGRRRLRYQRIVPLDPGAELIPHCEILLSVYDEQGVPLPLQPFIAAAEAFNMMREVDRQVIDDAFEWVHSQPARVRELGGIAINISGQSLSDPGLIEYIRNALERLRIPVELVSFEVTETAAIVNLDQAAILLGDLKSLGCRIALDDFGSGMSSYSYLKHLPVDYVKIDGSFVKDILVSPHDREIVKSFNEIAHFMGKKTIAEYVENLEILELLRDIGVDYAQGYAIEKPLFIDEMNS